MYFTELWIRIIDSCHDWRVGYKKEVMGKDVPILKGFHTLPRVRLYSEFDGQSLKRCSNQISEVIGLMLLQKVEVLRFLPQTLNTYRTPRIIATWNKEIQYVGCNVSRFIQNNILSGVERKPEKIRGHLSILLENLDSIVKGATGCCCCCWIHSS